MTLKKKPFENVVRKEENAGNQHFLLLPQFFYLIHNKFYHFAIWIIYNLSSANAFNLDWSEILTFGNGSYCQRLSAMVIPNFWPKMKKCMAFRWFSSFSQLRKFAAIKSALKTLKRKMHHRKSYFENVLEVPLVWLCDFA